MTEEKVEYCQRPECKTINATVEWDWDKDKPGAWGEKCCTNCGFRYAGVFCPYIPEDLK